MKSDRINLALADGGRGVTSQRLRFADGPSLSLAEGLGLIRTMGPRCYTRDGTFDLAWVPCLVATASAAGIEVAFPVPESGLAPPAPRG